MGTAESVQALIGRHVMGRDGERLGVVADVYIDETTGEPDWLAVKTGWFGTRTSFMPVAGAEIVAGEVALPYDREMVKAAPTVDANGALTADEEAGLFSHYGVTAPAEAPKTQPKAAAPTQGKADSMTRSEEELHVDTVQQEAGRVRLRKWVETEQVSRTVPVRREEVRVEREPISADNVKSALPEAVISEAEYEVVLHEEQVVAAKVTVPKERVRLKTRTVTEEQHVEAELRKERIEVEEDPPGGKRS